LVLASFIDWIISRAGIDFGRMSTDMAMRVCERDSATRSTTISASTPETRECTFMPFGRSNSTSFRSATRSRFRNGNWARQVMPTPTEPLPSVRTTSAPRRSAARSKPSKSVNSAKTASIGAAISSWVDSFMTASLSFLRAWSVLARGVWS